MTDGFSKTVTYQYNGMGDLSTVTVPYGHDYTYTYNANNQLASVTNEIYPITFTFEYDSGGRLTRMDRPGGYTLYEYNARNWVYYVRNRSSSSNRYQVKYFWDHVGNVTRKAEWFAGVSYYYWTYFGLDGVYRLTREARRHRNASVFEYDYRWGYDALGDRTTEQDLMAGGTRYYTYDGNDRLTKMGTTSGGNDLATFGYDGSGNMISVAGSLFGTRTLTYDDESRLTQIVYPRAGGGTWTDKYYYNALGQRMRTRLQGAWSRYIYAGERVLEETNDSGGMLARYALAGSSYFSPLLHMQRSSGESRSPLMDGVGTVRGLSDDTGGVTDRYSLDAFGAEFAAPTGSTVNPYEFGGAWGYLTDSSGLEQLGARFYWPELGRFVQQDPIGEGVNWYAYVGNNPLTRTDPTGLTDYFAVIEGEIATPWGGIDAAAGIVVDTDNWLDSGFFSTGGPAYGVSAGLGVGGGFADEIEGLTESLDVNLGDFSITIMGLSDPCEQWDELTPVTGGAITAGPGGGGAVSLTQTDTLTFGNIWDGVKRAGRWLRNRL